MSTAGRSGRLYWRLSGFYLCYFASLGVLVPYWGVYLKSLGFSAVEIGELLAIVMATKIVSPNLWGWMADHLGHRMPIVQLGSLLSALCFAGVLLHSGYWWMAAVMTGFSFFWNATLPQFEAVTMSHLGRATHRYSMVRLWGSVGFIFAVAGLGQLLDYSGPRVIPWTLLTAMIGIWAAGLWVPEARPEPRSEDPTRFLATLRRPGVLALLGVCFLTQAGHGPYYAFYTIYLEAHGYAAGLVGALWSLGVLAEIGVFLRMHHLLPRFGSRRLLLASLGLAGLRWVLIGWGVDHLEILVVAQLLHAATFGIYHAVSIHLINAYFCGSHQGRGQALYSSISFGAGGAVGSLYGGYLWDSAGPPAAFGLAAVASLMALYVGWRHVERPGTGDSADGGDRPSL